MLNTDQPIFLGLAGSAATGKTTTADGLAPMAQFMSLDDTDPVFWTHLFLAMPLYRMAAIRQKIVGIDAFDRQCYELHEALNDLFKGYITYDDTVETVYELASMDFPLQGKPRTFLQKAGTEICRTFDPDCFTKWVERKAREENSRFRQEWDKLNDQRMFTDEDWRFKPRAFGVVVSDIRFKNECAYNKDHNNGLLIKFTTRSEVVAERIYNRDGVVLTQEQMEHQSENDLSDLPDDYFDIVIDSSDLSRVEQVAVVKEFIYKEIDA